MRQFTTERRLQKFYNVAKGRQHSLHVVMENIHDPHNVSAIFRTCDAAGIPKVSLLYNIEPFPKIGKKSSSSAYKWVERDKFITVDDCYKSLKNNGFKIYASALTERAIDFYDLDLTEKCAIVLGNEHRGVSDEGIECADKTFIIPMFGMVQSLNVSVAAAVILYEAARQRYKKGMYEHSDLAPDELDRLVDRWCEK